MVRGTGYGHWLEGEEGEQRDVGEEALGVGPVQGLVWGWMAIRGSGWTWVRGKGAVGEVEGAAGRREGYRLLVRG